jgi:predicted Zn finger-like uncharacterized protein
MAFQIRCPSCKKLYAADERMAGKKIRCRNCNTVFAVEIPVNEPAMVPPSASGAGMRAHRLDDSIHQVESSDLTGTHRAMDAPPEPPDGQEDLFPAPEKPLLKPSLPQQFPGSIVIEAWLPLALTLISAVWCISTTFSNNATGKAWIGLVRIAFVAGLFLLLVAPVTYRVVKGQFKQMLRLLPPNPRFRVAATFALPAVLGYFFWLNIGSVGGLITGLILGLVLVAAVFWLLMRLDPQEAATVFAWAAGAFLLTTAIGGGILAGANALLNQAMSSAHAVAFHESPLGQPLAWTAPTPPPIRPPKLDPSPGADEIASTKSPVTQPSKEVAADDHPPTVAPATQIARAAPPVEDASNPVPNKTNDTSLFGNPDEDSFVAGIRQNNLSWVNHISRPAAQSSFDFTLSPIGASSFIALISSDGQMKLKLGELGANSYGETAKPIPLYGQIKDPEVFATQYSLSADGKVVLHLVGSQVQMIPTGGTESNFIPLIMPQAHGAQLKPTLLGAIRDPEFVVRWSAESCEQYVQRYSYLTRQPLSNLPIKEPPAALDACAVSANPEQQIFYAALFEPTGKSPQVRVFNLTSASTDWRPGTLPAAVKTLSNYEHAEFAFSADGKKLALLLEKGDEGRVTQWSIGNSALSLVFSTTCKIPTTIELTGRRGRGLQWLNGQYLVVHGQTLVSTLPNGPGVVGTLTSDTVTSQQVAAGNELLLTYTGADSHSHLVVVDINPDALRKITPK